MHPGVASASHTTSPSPLYRIPQSVRPNFIKAPGLEGAGTVKHPKLSHGRADIVVERNVWSGSLGVNTRISVFTDGICNLHLKTVPDGVGPFTNALVRPSLNQPDNR